MIRVQWINKKVLSAIFLAMILLSIGTFFFHHYEGWSYVDAFYFSTVTLTTVGYGDLAPTTDASKIFTALYAFFGIGIMLYLLGTVIGQYASRHEELFDKMTSLLRRIRPGALLQMQNGEEKEDKKR